MTHLKAWVGRLALAAIGIVFIAAGGLKALDPEGFTESVRGYGVIPDSTAPAVTYTLLPLEVALGVALLLDFHRKWAVGTAVALLLGFVGLLGYTWATGGDVSACGCFGRFAERTAGQTLAEDLAFLGLALLGLLAPKRSEAGGMGRGALTAAVALATLVLIPVAPALPLDGLVTSLRPGVALEELHLSLPDAAFSEGRHLVALLDLASEEVSGPAVEALGSLASAAGAPSVAVLYPNDEDVKDAFFWSWAPACPMYHVIPEEMRGLYRRLPRYFLVDEGVVTGVWNSMPAPEEVVEGPSVVAQETSP